MEQSAPVMAGLRKNAGHCDMQTHVSPRIRKASSPSLFLSQKRKRSHSECLRLTLKEDFNDQPCQVPAKKKGEVGKAD